MKTSIKLGRCLLAPAVLALAACAAGPKGAGQLVLKARGLDR